MAIASIVGGIGFAVAASVGGAGVIAGSIGFVAFGAIVIAVVVGVVGFLLTSLLGTGDLPSGDNTGSKTRLRTDPNNLLPIPYGRTRTAGQFVGGDNNEKEDQLSAICSFGEGPIEQVLSINWNDSLLYFPPNAQNASVKIKTNTKPPTFTSTNVGVSNKGLSRNNSVVNSVGRDGKDDEFLNKNMECRVYPNGNRNREMETFSPTKYGTKTDKRTNPNMAHAFMRIRFDAKKQVNGFTTNLFFNIKGKRVRTFNASGVLSSPTTGVLATALTVGNLYTITSTTGTNFTSAGANYNEVGEVFVATSTTTGTGTCTDQGLFYSNNPAECTLDYMTSTRYGGSILDNDINISSFFEWKKYCDEDVDYTEKVRTWLNGLSFTTGERANYRGRTFVSTQNDNMYEPANASFVLGTGWTQESTSVTATRTGTAKRYTCNGTLSTSDKISKNLDYLTSGSAGILNRNNGKYQIVIRRESTKVAGSFVVGRQYVIKSLTGTTQAQWNTTANTTGVTFTAGSSFFASTTGAGTGTADEIAAYLSEDDLIGELTISGTPLKELTNRLIIKYRDKDDFSQVRQVILDLRDSQNQYYTPSIVNESEPLVEKTKSLPMVNNSVEARRNGIVAINESRQGIQTKLTTSFKHLQVEAGDIVAVRHETPAWGWNDARTIKTAPKLFRVHSVVERVVRGAVVLDFNVVEYASESYTTGMIVQDDPAPNTGFREFSNVPDVNLTLANSSIEMNGVPISSLFAKWDNTSEFFKSITGRIIETSLLTAQEGLAVTTTVSGKTYTIASEGNTDFTLIGAVDSDVGTTFVSTGVGTGTGTVNNDTDTPWSNSVVSDSDRINISPLLPAKTYTVEYRVNSIQNTTGSTLRATATTSALSAISGLQARGAWPTTGDVTVNNGDFFVADVSSGTGTSLWFSVSNATFTVTDGGTGPEQPKDQLATLWEEISGIAGLSADQHNFIFQLQASSVTAIATPPDTAAGVLPTGWSDTVLVPSASQKLWISIGVQAGSIGLFDWGDPVPASGVDGPDGSLIFSGSDDPNTTDPVGSRTGDYYLDTDDERYYKKDSGGTWTIIIQTLKGTSGDISNIVYMVNPTTTPPAKPVDSTTRIPTETGWVDTFTYTAGTVLWATLGVQTNGTGNFVWTDAYEFSGQTGPAGITWHSGSATPAVSLGKGLDFYLKTSDESVYQKESDNSAWTRIITTLKGESGSLVEYIYRRQSTQPSTPSPSSSTPPSGWEDDSDSTTGTNTLWESVGTKTAGAANYIWRKPLQASATDGTDGTVTYTGTTSPNSIDPPNSVVGDLFLDTTSTAYYKKTGSSSWTLVISSLKGGDGARGTRSANGILYYQLAQSSAPSKPTLSGYDFVNNNFGSISANWSKNTVQKDPTATNPKYYAVTWSVSESTFGGTQTIKVSSVVNSENFTGVVSFTDLSTDGLTTIHGGNLETNTVTLSELKSNSSKTVASRGTFNLGTNTSVGSNLAVLAVQSTVSSGVHGIIATSPGGTAIGVAGAAVGNAFAVYGGNGFTSAFTAGTRSGVLGHTDNAVYAVNTTSGTIEARIAKDGGIGLETNGLIKGTAGIDITGAGAINFRSAVNLNGHSVIPFTGAHQAILPDASILSIGDIVIDLTVVGKREISQTLTTVSRSDIVNQKGASGIYSGDFDGVPVSFQREVITSVTTEGLNGNPDHTYDDISYELDPQYKTIYDNNDTILINALGEGLINVVNQGGDISIGDFIVCSDTAGKGMKQSDDIKRNYTVARSRENVSFENDTEVKQIACIYECG